MSLDPSLTCLAPWVIVCISFEVKLQGATFDVMVDVAPSDLKILPIGIAFNMILVLSSEGLREHPVVVLYRSLRKLRQAGV